MRLMTMAAVIAGVGVTVLLSQFRWAHRLDLVERLRPFAPGGLRAGGGRRGGSHSLRDVLGPLATGLGSRLARVLGTADDLGARLARAHSPVDPGAFRMRQVGWATAGLLAASVVGFVLGPPPLVTLLLVTLTPLLGFLFPEHRLSSACADHQRRISLELPIVAEQFGMLLSSGYSMTAALDRVAARTEGACALDLRRAMARIRQGLSPTDALNEWAEVADVDELRQFVSILVLHEDAGDLGRLISNEARAMRRGSQRELLARIERRSQQVWIPVTVAALVPGVLFLAIPFVSALSALGGL